MNPDIYSDAYLKTPLSDLASIEEVSGRFLGPDAAPGVPLAVQLDLMLIHASHPIDFPALLAASDHDLAREVVHLRAALDRKTGELHHYAPRFKAA